MKKIVMPGTEMSVSRLSFGTASLHHILSDKKRDALVRTAITNGISHFDTSPYYGYGLAENQLGKLSENLKQQITVASKIGIYPPKLSGYHIPIWSLKAMGKIYKKITKPVIDFSISQSEKSLHLTLKRLRREYIDILFLHEPSSQLVNTDEFIAWQERIIQHGKARYIGLAGPVDGFSDLLNTSFISKVLQVKDSLDKHEADMLLNTGMDLQFTYGYFSSLNRDRNTFSSTDILKRALLRNSTGSILVSTRRQSRIKFFSDTVTKLALDD